MENHVAAVNDIPQTVINLIQSRLNGREAAKTVVLAKSWYESWKNRSVLDFDERQFQHLDGFLNFIANTIVRYNDSCLKVDKFHLWMNVVEDLGSPYLASYLISKALKLGVNDFNVEIQSPIRIYDLPMSVFETTSIVRLSTSGCVIGRNPGEDILCSALKEVRLCDVMIDNDMMEGITTSCPLIENLFLSGCEGFSRVNITKLEHIEKVYIRMANSRSRALATRPVIEFHDSTIHGDQSDMPVFKRLSTLLLEGVKLHPEIFAWFSAMFPCLMDLTICHCYGYENIYISSECLKFIYFQSERRLNYAIFDVPSIKMFKYSGVLIRSLCFTNCSNEWESDITLSCRQRLLRISFFHELEKFLSSLSRSKVSLGMNVTARVPVGLLEDVKGLRTRSFKPAVDNFKLMELPNYHGESCSALWYGLLWSFSPKFIHHVPLHNSLVSGRFKHEDFWKAFAERMILHGTRTTQALSCVPGLEKINLEVFEETRSEWQPLPLNTFLNASGDGRKVRFQLKWK